MHSGQPCVGKTLLLIALGLAGGPALGDDGPPRPADPIRAFCVDFNWGPGGTNGFAPPGLWADADPQRHVDWYARLGANVIQTFAVSCNGYAWYQGGKVPPQPGLKHDFLTEVVRRGHARQMKVMAYFCVAANTRWGREHPELSYGTPNAYHLPLTDAYLDHLCEAVDDALRRTRIDGFMIDWLWCPTDDVRKREHGGRWLEAEKQLYRSLMGEAFPGEDRITPEQKLAYERKAIDRCWQRIRAAAKRANPDCVLWLSCNKVRSAAIAGSRLLAEIDWLMDEAGSLDALRAVSPTLGRHTRQVLCLVGWGDRHNARTILASPPMSGSGPRPYGVYGFTRPGPDSLPLPMETYLGRPIDSFRGNDRNIAVLARYFHDRPLDQ